MRVGASGSPRREAGGVLHRPRQPPLFALPRQRRVENTGGQQGALQLSGSLHAPCMRPRVTMETEPRRTPREATGSQAPVGTRGDGEQPQGAVKSRK